MEENQDTYGNEPSSYNRWISKKQTSAENVILHTYPTTFSTFFRPSTGLSNIHLKFVFSNSRYSNTAKFG